MDSGIRCWDRDVRRYVESDKIEEYHPFRLYFDTLPAWDGTDRITPLARRVSDSSAWVGSFHRWMLATTAQWMGFGDSNRANSVAPILISTRQGWGKSTFCRMLMPERLNRYFTESYDLNMPAAAECKLATFGMINMDEFDKLPVKKMPLLKNLMQMESLNIRKAYKKSTEPLGRIASFIGTSNRRDLLTDASGSRRFVCVELTHAIDCSPIDHDQIYAQLKQELENGERYWFSKEEERDIQAANRTFYRTAPEEDVFHRCLRFAAPEEEGARLLTAAEIFGMMKKENPAAMRGTTCNAVSRMLPAMGQRVHTKYCNGYWIKEV
jgi:predicted P-loop ATPase